MSTISNCLADIWRVEHVSLWLRWLKWWSDTKGPGRSGSARPSPSPSTPLSPSDVCYCTRGAIWTPRTMSKVLYARTLLYYLRYASTCAETFWGLTFLFSRSECHARPVSFLPSDFSINHLTGNEEQVGYLWTSKMEYSSAHGRIIDTPHLPAVNTRGLRSRDSTLTRDTRTHRVQNSRREGMLFINSNYSPPPPQPHAQASSGTADLSSRLVIRGIVHGTHALGHPYITDLRFPRSTLTPRYPEPGNRRVA